MPFSSLPPIYFYIPKKCWPNPFPQNALDNWAGFGLGIYAWTLQTYLHLCRIEFPCQLVSHIPDQGIILFHRNALRFHPQGLKPNASQLLVCIKAEERLSPWAQIHVVQNPREANEKAACDYLPHWPQPGLLPRSLERGDRFETIGFYGHSNNLAPELQTEQWQKDLQELKLKWHPVINNNSCLDYKTINTQWADYRELDAVVAIRSFQDQQKFPNKPATKLVNAWLGGVIPLLGQEWAYRLVGQPGFNYLEISNYSQLLEILKTLKMDRNMRSGLLYEGQRQTSNFTVDSITKTWKKWLENRAIPAFESWIKTPLWQQKQFLLQTYILRKGKRVYSRLFQS